MVLGRYLLFEYLDPSLGMEQPLIADGLWQRARPSLDGCTRVLEFRVYLVVQGSSNS